jgi:hypothetical protein
VSHSNIVIEVKSDNSSRSAGQHPEYQVDVKNMQNGSFPGGVSPAHALK